MRNAMTIPGTRRIPLTSAQSLGEWVWSRSCTTGGRLEHLLAEAIDVETISIRGGMSRVGGRPRTGRLRRDLRRFSIQNLTIPDKQ
jgi:hypothetical protein